MPLLSAEEAILRIFMAVLLGSIIGLERELTQKSAGLRTHILVCLGSAVFTIISLTIGRSAGDLHPTPALPVGDPGRIAAQIVTGIGFIGGGAVLRHGTSVRGITTAASLWMMASIGMLVGMGGYRLSLIATLISFLVLFTIGHMERSLFRKTLRPLNRVSIHLVLAPQQVEHVSNWLEKQFGTDVLELKTAPHADNTTVSVIVNLQYRRLEMAELARRINALPGILSSDLRLFSTDAE